MNPSTEIPDHPPNKMSPVAPDETAAAVLGAAAGILLTGVSITGLKGYLRVVLWALVWFAYFTVSKRVKATYPDAHEPLMPPGAANVP